MVKPSGEIMEKILLILGILLFINLLVVSLNKAFASNFIEDLQANYQIELGNFL